ncbi:hypothetical protein DKM44_06535 [Deinococcus irradiatisoli]|uniref:Uncharacterized protein n=1 Tax=Deinococcus irradiatisoli TaxID=2202254 RepID=A0A2Z3JG19_9DEIO|nr:hypothetical protein [Deinococcus irradiatisoli]AWN22926.1 hypothetical protein DKM44_06535 [Deinococcus irradiatisoli]
MNERQALIEQLTGERKVRALAETGSHGTPLAWAGSQPGLLSFERGLNTLSRESGRGVRRLRVPYEVLERWQEADTALLAAPLPPALLAQARVVYDPAGALTRVQRQLQQLTPQQFAVYRESLIQQAETRLEAVEALLQRGSGVAAQLLALADARRAAVECLYPALLTHLQLWPASGVRLPHFWRAQAGLPFPKAVGRLDQLYAFGAEAEARRVLLATRGLNLVEQEKRARLAVQAGYYDGAVRFLRDEAAQRWRADLERWPYLSGARQDKLGTLLGAGSSPLGPVAAALVRDLIADVRAGR